MVALTGGVAVLGVVLSLGVFVALRIWRRKFSRLSTKMAKAGSPLFKVGYYLYAKTRVGQLYYRRELSKARRKYRNEGHSIIETKNFNGDISDLQVKNVEDLHPEGAAIRLKIIPIAMSLDNYGYLIMDTREGTSILIDPADVERVQPVLDQEKATPIAILCTHKHWDHSGGNAELKRRYPDVKIYGSAADNIPLCTDPVVDTDKLTFGQLLFTVHTTPGHTTGHCIYLLSAAAFGAPPSLFSGDHLFLAGIGRMFECPPSVMLRSLDRLQELPEDTLLWPGHEYAQDNLEFAASLEPDNEDIQNTLKWAQERRNERLCTCPTLLREEKKYNPFLRTNKDTILTAVGVEKTGDMDEVRANALGEIRARKDKFKYKL